MLSVFPRGVLDEILNLIESVSEGFPSYFSIPIPLDNQNVLPWCLVYGFLELLVEVFDLTVIMTRCWCINLYDGDIERSCSQAD